MRYFRGFENLDMFGFKGNLTAVLGTDYRFINRKFIRPNTEVITSMVRDLEKFGVKFIKTKYFKDSTEIKNLTLELPDDYHPKNGRDGDKEIAEFIEYMYDHGFDIQLSFYEPDWQRYVGGVWDNKIKFIRTSREKFMNDKIEYNSRYNDTYNMMCKYISIRDTDIVMEDPNDELTKMEKLVMWLRYNWDRKVEVASIMAGYGQTPQSGGTIYYDYTGYFSHPFYDTETSGSYIYSQDKLIERKLKEGFELKDVQYIWDTLSFISQMNYPCIEAKRYKWEEVDRFFNHTIYKF